MGTAAKRSRRQASSHEEYWARPQVGKLTYVALGDSAGVGVGVTDPRQGYVGIIARRIQRETGETVKTVNLAVSGAKAIDVLDSQIPKLSSMATPDFVTCVIGGNDVAWDPFFRTQRFSRTVRAILARLPECSVMGLMPDFVHWPYSLRVRRANDVIRDEAYASGVSVADIYAATKGLSFVEYLRTFAGDYFHPNQRGHQIWADEICDKINTDKVLFGRGY